MSERVELQLWGGRERPFPATDMTPERWRDEVNPRPVPIADIVLVGSELDVQRLVFADGCDDGDPYPHVVAWAGHLWLADGIHRVLRLALAGAATVEVRVHEA